MNSFKNCTILYNSLSGKQKFQIYKDEIIRTVTEKIGDIPNCYDVITIGKNGLSSFMKEEGSPLYLSVGGDGTLKEIVSSSLQLETIPTIAHLPLGSVNDIGNNFFYTKDPITNLKKILDGSSYKLDICDINGTTFNYFGGLGTIPSTAYGTSQKLKNKFGFSALLGHTIKETLLHGMEIYDLTYEEDGISKSIQTPFVFIGNTRCYSGFSEIIPNAVFDDGLFEVLIMDSTNLLDIMRIFMDLTGGKKNLQDIKGLIFFQTNKLNIKLANTPKWTWALDGEKYSDSTNEFKFGITKNIDILMPSETIEAFQKQKIKS